LIRLSDCGWYQQSRLTKYSTCQRVCGCFFLSLKKRNTDNLVDMIRHSTVSSGDLWRLIRQQAIRFGGNGKLKIYGTLRCRSGKRIKRENRIFFYSENEAIENGFRPCGHCMKQAYQHWKNDEY